MQLGLHAAAMVLLGLLCGLLASSLTVWLLVRRGSPVRLGGVPVVPAGLIPRVFASPEFRRELRDALLASPAVQAGLHAAVHEQVASYGARQLREIAPPELRERALTRLQGAVSGPEAERLLRQGIGSALHRIAASEVPLRRFVVWDFSPVIAAAVKHVMPMVVAQLGAALRERETRIQLHVALRGMVDRFLAEQEGWKRTVGAFLLTDRALAHLVDRISTTGVEALSRTLCDPATQGRVVAALDDSLRRTLDRSPRDLMGGLAPDRVVALPDQVTDRLLALLRSPSGQERVAEALRTTFSRFETLPLASVAGLRSPADLERVSARLSSGAVTALRSHSGPTPSPGQVIVRAVRPHLARVVALGAGAAAALALLASLAFDPR